MKKLFIMALGCAVASMANAGWLYWQLADSTTSSDLEKPMAYAATLGQNWNYARFYSVNDSTGDKEMLTTLYNTEYVASQKSDFDYATGVVEIDMKGLESGYSFYIELVNAASASAPSTTLIGYQDATYANLSGSVQTTRLDIGNIPEAAIWHGAPGGYNAPEPTSAVLMMLGVAGLALRRKQRKLA